MVGPRFLVTLLDHLYQQLLRVFVAHCEVLTVIRQTNVGATALAATMSGDASGLSP